MKSRPKVSIITITYNHEQYIRQALDSFVMQKTDFNFEVVVADDHSTDETPNIISEYAQVYPDIIRPMLRKQNLGAIANCLDALKAAKGEYIALCEGDDFWTRKTKLQQQADLLDANPDMALCFHPVKVFFEGDIEEESLFPGPQYRGNKEHSIEDLLHQNFIPTNSVMFRRGNLDSLPDDVMPFDWYLHLFNASKGRIGYIDKVMAAYRRHPGGIWWDSYKDMDKLWARYGLQHVRFYLTVRRLFGKKAQYVGIIDESYRTLLKTLVDVDGRLQSRLIADITEKLPEIAKDVLAVQTEKIIELSSTLAQKERLLKKKSSEIEALQADMNIAQAAADGLRSQHGQLVKELKFIKSSRLWKVRVLQSRLKVLARRRSEDEKKQ